MRPLILIGLLFATVAGGADEHLHQLVAAVTTRPWPGKNYPELPTLSPALEEKAAAEIAASPAVRDAIAKLNATRSNVDWFAGIKVLEEQKAVWSLQVALCHPHEDVQIHALRALGRLKDSRAVPFLLVYADHMSGFVGGSEAATLHGIIQEDTANTLSLITGVQITLKGQDPESLKKAVLQWKRWQLDHAK